MTSFGDIARDNLQNRFDVWLFVSWSCEKLYLNHAQDVNCKGLGDLIHCLVKTRNLKLITAMLSRYHFHCVGDTLHEFITEFQDGINLFCDILRGYFLSSTFSSLEMELLSLSCQSLSTLLKTCEIFTGISSWQYLHQILQFVERISCIFEFGIGDSSIQISQRSLTEFVRGFAEKRVNEISSAESSCDERPDTLARSLNTDLCITTNMGKNLTVAQLNKRKFNPIRMSAKIFECMK